MKQNIILFLALVLALSLCACGQKTENAPTWKEQYDLGVRYLSEGNYEQAILAFEAAIEIDPKQVDAYIALAEVYTAQGDTEKAAEILAWAIAEIGETAELVEALAAVVPATEPTPEPTPEPSPEPTSEQVGPRTERSDFPDGSYMVKTYDADNNETSRITYDANGNATNYAVFGMKEISSDFVTLSELPQVGEYQHFDLERESIPANLSIRGITKDDTLHTVLRKLGFEQSEAEFISKYQTIDIFNGYFVNFGEGRQGLWSMRLYESYMSDANGALTNLRVIWAGENGHSELDFRYTFLQDGTMTMFQIGSGW